MKITDPWKETDLTVLQNPSKPNEKDSLIIGGTDEIYALLDDSLVALNTILSSRFCAPLRGIVNKWQKDLNLMQETLDEWCMCQKQVCGPDRLSSIFFFYF